MTETSRILPSLARTILPAILLLSLAAARGSAQADTGGSRPQEPRRGQYSIKPFRVIGNVYSVGLSNNTSYLITTPQGHFLIDPTLEQAVPDIRKNIEQLGFNVKDIKIILPTHAHSDHVGGLAEFKELTGAKVMIMAADAETVADGGKGETRDGKPQWKPVAVDHPLHDGEKVDLGGVTMVAHLTAGHTKGCTSWSTVAEENGRKYNVVFVCSIRMTGVPLIGNTKYPNVADDHANGLKTLKSLPVDVWLVSHSYMFGMDEKIKRMGSGPNPFIDPDGYRAYLAENEKALQDQLQQERAGGPPFAGRIPPPGVCPEDGRTCYGAGR